MPETDASAVSAIAVENEIVRGARTLRFATPVETLFLDEYMANRARLIPLWALVGTLMYCVALVGDFSMLPDVAWITPWLRVGVFAPFALLVVLIMRYRPSAAAYDLLSLAVGVLGISIPMVPLIYATGPYVFIYQTGSVATLAFFVIVLRPRFRTVLWGLAIMTAIQLATTRLNGGFDDVTYGGIANFYLTLAVFLALSAYFFESVDRMNFLYRLKGSLLQEELRAQSEQDLMSGLYNRRSLARYERDLWTAAQSDATVCAIMLDIDHFKSYNDTHGHLAGDACITAVSQIVRSRVGARGRAFRFGGEELLVVLPGMAREEARALAEEIRAAIEGMAIHHRGLRPSGVVTASLGVAAIRAGEGDLQTLLQAADTALYAAKDAGRNRVRVWNAHSSTIQPSLSKAAGQPRLR